MNTFVTSDTHFNHKNICEYSHRPFNSVQEMNECVIENWNKEVKPEDEVWHVGDACLGPKSEMAGIMNRLNGKITLIRGNHEGVQYACPERFEKILDYKELHINGKYLVLMHYPLEVWNNCHNGSWHIHGHCHGNLTTKRPFRFDVGIDSVARWLHKKDLDRNITNSLKLKPEYYRPLNVEELDEVFVNDVFERLDHHA